MTTTTLDVLLAAGFTYEESVHFMQIITEGGPLPSSTSEAVIPPVIDAPLSGGSNATWAAIPGPVPGPSITSDMHPTTPDVPAPAPPVQALLCRLTGGATCTQPLYGTMSSIREHIRMHGHKHSRRSTVQCPWTGCRDQLQWANMMRHIRSIHMGIRLQCWACGKFFTRAKALERHIASSKNNC
ncbi:hypothetical protein PAXINDRAFT_18059 [Paxillus involutus ATCC 200175]|uniref:C2H2-type domain-containing protein n=1 Tax=Paxillus involutus ATCC 200175 TaxID=664439 RepID=A0A0C9SPA7_PAXIN|nr:hypothetical protein PAXINDRAFT_18059 [Paxillus involutus ATCC 200175]